MFRTALCLSLFAAFAHTASANALQDRLLKSPCWQRVYTDEHLASHPKQAVTRVRLSSEMQDDGTMWANIGFNLRQRLEGGGDSLDYAIAGVCEAKREAVLCRPEWDAGTFMLETGPDGTLRVHNGKLMVNPANYAAEELAPNAADLSKSDDAIWQLSPLEDPTCPVY